PFAKILKDNKTYTIGVLIPSITNNFFAQVVNGIEMKASELGYKIIICISNESVEKEAEGVRTFINAQVDGLIISLSEETQSTKEIQHLKNIKNDGIPIVSFDRLWNNIDIDKISIRDDFHSTVAVKDLVQRGCSKIVFVSGIPFTSVSVKREEGYLNAVKSLGLNSLCLKYEKVLPKDEILELARLKKIDAVLASDEFTAISVMRCLLTNGFRIPEDILVIGFSNGILGENFIPSLSVIDSKAMMQGELALETLVKRINGKLPLGRIEITINAEIIHRESTKVRN
ncbi:MAG: substrate-binding domain-containing protein, partial [Gillisia sp.]